MKILRHLLARLGFTWRTLTLEESAVVRAVAEVTDDGKSP